MTDASVGDIPLACNLSVARLMERGGEVGRLFARAHTLRELPDGYGFGFAPDADTLRDVLAFALEERDCCPFYSFEVSLPSPHRSVWLFIRGPEGAKDLAQGMFVSKVVPQAGA